MDCHGENQKHHGENSEKLHGHGLHMLLMILCCAIPLILLFALPALKINDPALNRIIASLSLLLCPLMHLIMIPMMLRKDKS